MTPCLFYLEPRRYTLNGFTCTSTPANTRKHAHTHAWMHTHTHTSKQLTKRVHNTVACIHTQPHTHARSQTVMTWWRTLDILFDKIMQSQFGDDIWQVWEYNSNDKHLTVPLFSFPWASRETKGKSKAHNYHVWHERQVDSPALSVARWNGLSPPSWHKRKVGPNKVLLGTY